MCSVHENLRQGGPVAAMGVGIVLGTRGALARQRLSLRRILVFSKFNLHCQYNALCCSSELRHPPAQALLTKFGQCDVVAFKTPTVSVLTDQEAVYLHKADPWHVLWKQLRSWLIYKNSTWICHPRNAHDSVDDRVFLPWYKSIIHSALACSIISRVYLWRLVCVISHPFFPTMFETEGNYQSRAVIAKLLATCEEKNRLDFDLERYLAKFFTAAQKITSKSLRMPA